MNRSLIVAVAVLLLIGAGTAIVVMRGGSETAPSTRLGGPGTWDDATRQHVALERERIEELLNRANFIAARVAVADLLQDYPGDPQLYVLLTKAAMGQQQWHDAYDAAIKAVELDPTLHGIHFLAGVLAEQERQLETAAGHYEQALEGDNHLAKYALYLANVLLKTNRHDDAQLYALRTLQLDPNIAQARVILAEVAARQGKLDMALEQITQAIALASEGSEERLAYILHRVRYLRRQGPSGREEALADLHALPASYHRQRRMVTQELAQTYLSLERPADAADVWSAWFESHPNDAAAAAETGLALIRAGEPDVARQYLQIARQTRPHDPVVQALDKAIEEEKPDQP